LYERRIVKSEMKMFSVSGCKRSYTSQNNIPVLHKPISTGTQ